MSKSNSPHHFMTEYTFNDCQRSCKIKNDPMRKCGTTSSNPLDLTFNEDFKGANCVIGAKLAEKKCINKCKR